MLITTVKDRYETIIAVMDKIDHDCGMSNSVRGFAVRGRNQAMRFMDFELKYPLNSEDEEYNEWKLCEFFDRKYYEDERFAKRRGVGAGILHYLRNVGEELDRVHI